MKCRQGDLPWENQQKQVNRFDVPV